MGELADLLRERGADLVEDHAPGAVERLIDRGRDLVDAELDGEDADRAGEALDRLEEVAEPAARLGRLGLVMAVDLIADGGDAEADAERLFMAREATQAERDRWIEERGRAEVGEHDEKAQAWEALKSGVKAAVEAGGGVLLGLLRRAVGL